MKDKYIGKKYGHLTVVKRLNEKAQKYRYFYQCKCSCGRFCTTTTDKLIRGKRIFCNRSFHQKYERHGRSNTNLYKIFRDMLRRCHDKKHRMYAYYGARNIKVCMRWRSSFAAFLKDIGERPSKNHSLERLKNHDDYKPGNVAWKDKIAQANNRRTNRIVTFNGQKMTAANAARRYGKVSYSTFMHRLYRKNKWTVETALLTPARKRHRHCVTSSSA